MNLSISSSLSNLLAYNSSQYFFLVHQLLCFSFLFCPCVLSLYCFVNLARGLSILLIFSRNRFLVLLTFPIFLSLFYWFPVIFYYFLPSTHFRFCCPSFLNLLSGRLGCLFGDFSYFLREELREPSFYLAKTHDKNSCKGGCCLLATVISRGPLKDVLSCPAFCSSFPPEIISFLGKWSSVQNYMLRMADQKPVWVSWSLIISLSSCTDLSCLCSDSCSLKKVTPVCFSHCG